MRGVLHVDNLFLPSAKPDNAKAITISQEQLSNVVA